MSGVVSANEAARRFGLSEKTVRRWIAAGKLTADKRGRAYRVSLSEVAALNGQPKADNPGPSANGGQTADIRSAPPTADSTSAMSGIPELVQLVARLHDEVSRSKSEVAEYAATAAMWQARARMLEERVLALEAPKPDPEPAPDPFPRPNPPTPNAEPWDARWQARVTIAAALLMVALTALVATPAFLNWPR